MLMHNDISLGDVTSETTANKDVNVEVTVDVEKEHSLIIIFESLYKTKQQDVCVCLYLKILLTSGPIWFSFL